MQYPNPYTLDGNTSANDENNRRTLKGDEESDSYKYFKQPSFVWVSSSDDDDFNTLETVLDAAGSDELVQVAVYNLPARDCNASSSDGELTTFGEYQKYIRRIKKTLDNYKEKTNISIGLEPDSMANIASLSPPGGCDEDSSGNLINCDYDSSGNPVSKCAINRDLIMTSLRYAANELKDYPIYADCGHSAWTAYNNNFSSLLNLFNEEDDKYPALRPALKESVRGCAFNTSNYHYTGVAPDENAFNIPDSLDDTDFSGVREYCCAYASAQQKKPTMYRKGRAPIVGDGACPTISKPDEAACTEACTLTLLGGYDTVANEASLAKMFALSAKNIGMKFQTEDGVPRSIIDVGRNGQDAKPGDKCDLWCNVPDGRISKYPPNSATAIQEANLCTDSTNYDDCYVDALVWYKPPGEGDGNVATDGCCEAERTTCMNSCDDTPAAGEWFPEHAKTLCDIEDKSNYGDKATTMCNDEDNFNYNGLACDNDSSTTVSMKLALQHAFPSKTCPFTLA